MLKDNTKITPNESLIIISSILIIFTSPNSSAQDSTVRSNEVPIYGVFF